MCMARRGSAITLTTSGGPGGPRFVTTPGGQPGDEAVWSAKRTTERAVNVDMDDPCQLQRDSPCQTRPEALGLARAATCMRGGQQARPVVSPARRSAASNRTGRSGAAGSATAWAQGQEQSGAACEVREEEPATRGVVSPWAGCSKPHRCPVRCGSDVEHDGVGRQPQRRGHEGRRRAAIRVNDRQGRTAIEIPRPGRLSRRAEPWKNRG